MRFLLRRRDHALVLPRVDVVQRPLEMSLGVLQRRRLLIGLEVRVDELDQAVEIFRRHLSTQEKTRSGSEEGIGRDRARERE